MTRVTRRWLEGVWLVVAILLAVGSMAGGDTSIESGFLWLAWTAPVGLIWQFLVYGSALKVAPANVVNVAGLVIVLVLAYLFWFQLVPALFRAARRTQ
jgi:hypothetical protein